MSETISGKIIDAGPEGLTIRAPYSDWQRFVLRRYEDVQVLLCDGRQLSPKQSRAIHAMVHDIAPVSYTHLDVYKRQACMTRFCGCCLAR